MLVREKARGEGLTSPLPSPVVTPLRRSERHVVASDGSMATDEDSMARAMRRKAEQNLDKTSMNTPPKSFLTFSNATIAAKLNSVGFSLDNNVEIIAMSTNALRHLEYDRLTVNPKVSCKSHIIHEDQEEHNDTIDVQLLSHLVGDVSEGGLDEAMLSSLYDLKASDRKSKADSHKKKNKTPRKKAKFSTSPIVSQ